MCCVVLRAPEGGPHTACRRGFQGKGGGVGVVLGKRVNGKGSQRRGEEQGIEGSGGRAFKEMGRASPPRFVRNSKEVNEANGK